MPRRTMSVEVIREILRLKSLNLSIRQIRQIVMTRNEPAFSQIPLYNNPS